MTFEKTEEGTEQAENGTESDNIRSEPKIDVAWADDPVPVSEATKALSDQVSDLYRQDGDTTERLEQLEELVQAQEQRMDNIEQYVDILATVSPASIYGQCSDCNHRLTVNKRMLGDDTVECTNCDNIAAKVE